MKFINQLNTVINDPGVQKQTRFLLKKGAQDPLFRNYFGVNYNDTDLVSVKLYFSFLTDAFNKELFEYFNISKEFRELIEANWKPSDSFDFVHQGLTFSLKCYYEKGEVKIASYVHFRTPNFALGYPKDIQLTEEDLKNYPGICIESLNGKDELKKYFYITSDVNKRKLAEQFGLSDKLDISLCNFIEYTESDVEKKINVDILSADHVTELLLDQKNEEIMELSKELYTKYKLYYRAPGYRFNNATKAIYYMPRESYYHGNELDTIKHLFV